MKPGNNLRASIFSRIYWVCLAHYLRDPYSYQLHTDKYTIPVHIIDPGGPNDGADCRSNSANPPFGWRALKQVFYYFSKVNRKYRHNERELNRKNKAAKRIRQQLLKDIGWRSTWVEFQESFANGHGRTVNQNIARSHAVEHMSDRNRSSSNGDTEWESVSHDVVVEYPELGSRGTRQVTFYRPKGPR